MGTNSNLNRHFANQRTFRKLLEAMSNPGRTVELGKGNGKRENDYEWIFQVGECLLDSKVSYGLLGECEYLAGSLKTTQGMLKPIEESDYIFILVPYSDERIEEILSQCKSGVLSDPDQSSTIIILLESIEGKCSMRLKGPGIPGEVQYNYDDEIYRWVCKREQMNYGYPLGVDLIFVTGDGSMMALPRLVKPLDN